MEEKKIKTEDLVLNFWKENKIFEKSLEKESPLGEYVFYDGPPFATGTPHYGHIVGQIIKDVVPRFFTMKGYRVDRKWGWDCHGLPIENIVEKEMGTKTKKDIEDIGIAKFNNACRSKVLEYSANWYETSDKLGRFVDKENAYHTMDLNYMESVWWAFKKIWDKGLIYKDYRSMHVCPRCETTLAQSEVSEGYQDIKDLSCVAKFELLDEENTFVLAWTTTPWTLIGNVALAIGPDIRYVKVSHDNSYYILAKDRLEDAFKDKEYELIEEFEAQKIVGKSYRPVFDYYINDLSISNRENAWKIYLADFVTTEDGVGVVHIAPAFGQDDMDLSKEYNLPLIQHVNIDGSFKEEVLDFKGLNVKPADNHMATDIEIIKYLAGKNLLFSKEKYDHSYPHCWRCDTPLMNYATSSWFVSVLKIKEQLLESAKDINWSPDYIKKGRFGNWLEGARDWSISRQRFWASAIPIWECSCGERKVIGSVKELEDLSGETITDIHKDVVDEISFKCHKCSEEMKRVPDVLDCWFESGAMPYAQLHYPFENKDKFDSNFPAEFIAEGIDQTRTWFYYLHVISGAINSSSAFKNVIVNGIVLAEDGKKMSKRLKNYPDPMLIIDKYGADSLRAYILSSPVVLAENLNFSERGVEEALRKNVMLVNNIYNFYQMYEGAPKYEESDNVLDVWITVKINALIKEVEEAMLAYNLNKAVRPITEFIDELSTWYLRRSRDRLREGDASALSTLRFVFVKLSKVMAPFMPFIAESLWQRVNGLNFSDKDRSVHLEAWPSFKENEKEEEILENMAEVRKIVELGLAKRDEAGIKVRQALGSATVLSENSKLGAYVDLIKEELNVKEVEIKEEEGETRVELDLHISEELKKEGIKRELVRFINLARKNKGLTIDDLVEIEIQTNNEMVKEALSLFEEDIKKETLSSKISSSDLNEDSDDKKFKIEGEEMLVIIK